MVDISAKDVIKASFILHFKTKISDEELEKLLADLSHLSISKADTKRYFGEYFNSLRKDNNSFDNNSHLIFFKDYVNLRKNCRTGNTESICSNSTVSAESLGATLPDDSFESDARQENSDVQTLVIQRSHPSTATSEVLFGSEPTEGNSIEQTHLRQISHPPTAIPGYEWVLMRKTSKKQSFQNEVYQESSFSAYPTNGYTSEHSQYPQINIYEEPYCYFENGSNVNHEGEQTHLREIQHPPPAISEEASLGLEAKEGNSVVRQRPLPPVDTLRRQSALKRKTNKKQTFQTEVDQEPSFSAYPTNGYTSEHSQYPLSDTPEDIYAYPEIYVYQNFPDGRRKTKQKIKTKLTFFLKGKKE